LAKPNQIYASKRRTLAANETVTVVDPRHPLYGLTFPLLHLKNKQELIPSCLVRLAEGVERLIPVNVTNLAATPPIVYPLPLDLSSLHNLTQVFLRIQMQIGKECGDGSPGSAQFSRNGINDGDGVGNTDGCTAGNGAADDGVDLSPACRTMDAEVSDEPVIA
jgi:hypothetical protein